MDTLILFYFIFFGNKLRELNCMDTYEFYIIVLGWKLTLLIIGTVPMTGSFSVG